jgi:hypothetical protein
MTNSIMIQCIDCKYDAAYIANVLWNKDIAKVSSITLIPQFLNGKILNIAYITIASYCESEIAYDLILRTKSEAVEVIHDNDKDSCEVSWWVKKNTHNSGDICVGSYTTKFDDSFFPPKIEEDQTSIIGEDNDHYYDDIETYEEPEMPIRDMWGRMYTVNQAQICVELMKSSTDETSKNERDQELAYLENELNIHKMVENSQHVTNREKHSSVDDLYDDLYNSYHLIHSKYKKVSAKVGL